MKGVVRKLFVVAPIVALTSVSLIGDVKTTDRTSIKFEGMLGHVVGFFGGKAAKEGVESSVAVKGNRKATFNDSTGQIVDLSEEKVYDLDMHKKTYTVTTFDEIRQKMREEAERAQKEAKEQPGQQQPEQKPEKPQKEYEVDFDVKETGQKKQLAGYDTHEVIATVTVREKGKTLEDGGGVVMTNDMWLGPEIPQLREVAQFDMRYWQQLQQGALQTSISPEQMAMVIASFPGVRSAMERFAKEGGKLQGTALDTMSTFEGVKSQEQMAEEQKQQNSDSGGGSLTGMFAKKMMKKKEAPKQRGTIFTTHHEVLSVSTTVGAEDLAIPAGFKEKKK